MIYNGIDLGGYLKVYGYSGVDNIPISETVWSPTLGDGGKISLFRRPTLTITVSALIETDDTGTLDEKIAYLRTVFTAGKDFVPIVFDERDPLTRRGRVTGVTQSAYYFTIAEYKITFVVDPYRYGDDKTVAGSGAKISSMNAGTASALGKISFTVAGGNDGRGAARAARKRHARWRVGDRPRPADGLPRWRAGDAVCVFCKHDL